MSFLTQPISISSIFGTKRTIGDIELQVVVNENTSDILTITKQAVQQGAPITDHAYKEPTVYSVTAFFPDNIFVSLSKVYQDLLDLQNAMTPFVVVTPKRVYPSMLLAALGQTTDKLTEHCLSVSMSFQQVIIVNVTTSQLPVKNQRSPKVTQATKPAGARSGLAILAGKK